MAVKVTCINKGDVSQANPYLEITHFGWVNEGSGISGTCTRLELYDYIWYKIGVAYIKDGSGNQIALITSETADGSKYLTTANEDMAANSLLSLPECE